MKKSSLIINNLSFFIDFWDCVKEESLSFWILILFKLWDIKLDSLFFYSSGFNKFILKGYYYIYIELKLYFIELNFEFLDSFNKDY